MAVAVVVVVMKVIMVVVVGKAQHSLTVMLLRYSFRRQRFMAVVFFVENLPSSRVRSR
jgi:hypothetical protein